VVLQPLPKPTGTNGTVPCAVLFSRFSAILQESHLLPAAAFAQFRSHDRASEDPIFISNRAGSQPAMLRTSKQVDVTTPYEWKRSECRTYGLSGSREF
jgi:hypothetical protein